MIQRDKDALQFQLPDQPSAVSGNEAPVVDAPAYKQAEGTYSEAPWSQENTVTAPVATESLTDMEQFIEVAWKYSDALKELRRDALGE